MKTVQSAIAMQVRVLALSLGIILSGLVVSGTAGAAPIQFSFTGIVQGSSQVLSPPFFINQPMSGFFTVNSPLDATTDDNPSGNIATYNDRITNLSVTIGTSPTPYVATFGQPNNHITIRNLLAFDSGELVVNTLTSGAPVNGVFTPTMFDITLEDGTAGAFNSQYPTTVPSLSSFLTTNQWRLVFTPGGGVVQGMLTSLTAVPLPAAVLLFGAGLISLVGLGAGGLRNLRGPQA
jgi:hypothetical protein